MCLASSCGSYATNETSPRKTYAIVEYCDATLMCSIGQLNLEDKTVTQFVKVPEAILEVEVSLDSHKVAYTTGDAVGGKTLFVLDLVSGDTRQLIVDQTGFWIRGLTWFPDGTRIGFSSNKDQADNNVGLFYIDTSSQQITPISTSRPVSYFGSWSPDGKLVALEFSDDDKSEIVLWNTESLSPIRSLGDGYSPAWSPDGKYIVYTRLVDGQGGLYLYEASTGQTSQLSYYNPLSQGRALYTYSWNPKGNGFAYIVELWNYNRRSFYIQSVGHSTEVEFVDFSGLLPGAFSWSPDGENLYVELLERDAPLGESKLYEYSLSDKSLDVVLDKPGFYSVIGWLLK